MQITPNQEFKRKYWITDQLNSESPMIKQAIYTWILETYQVSGFCEKQYMLNKEGWYYSSTATP